MFWRYWVGKGANEAVIMKELVRTHKEAWWPRHGHIKTQEQGA